ncbi:MAG: heat-inducible transcriptional repressor HrcA [Fibrobacterota bacterium]|nr:heat-inducible transcriptional repressor HrcA [Fibrobacterota bacterium]
MNTPLNPRQKQVLTAIVDHYIVKAEPVSSKVLSVNPLLQASSATIRNTMAELEDLGFVEQPHTSAGRTPTDQGYRTYVNDLMQVEALSPEEQRTIEFEVSEVHEEQELMAHTARILGNLTHQLGVAVSPSVEESLFKNLSLVPLDENRVMIVLSVSETVFRTTLVDSGVDTSIYRLESIARRINERMQGKPVSFLNSLLRNPKESSASEEEKKAFSFFDRSISKLFKSQSHQEVQISGTKNIFSRADFEKLEDLESILDLLDSKMALVHFLRQRNEKEGVHVTIGEEHQEGHKLRSVSIVTSAFSMGGAHGIIGVIGPKRMPYSRLISIVDHTAKALNRKDKTQKGLDKTTWSGNPIEGTAPFQPDT